jgi:hypothetical protein
VPASGVALYVNREPLTTPRALVSGDVIRMGHWTFRFVRTTGRATAGRRGGDVLGRIAQVLVAAILVLEVAVVSWVPRRISAARFWEAGVARQQTVLLFDHVRTLARRREDPDPLIAAARRTVLEELDALARYLRRNEDRMTSAQFRRVYRDLQEWERILVRIDDGGAFRDLPEVDIGDGVRAVLEAASGGIPAEEVVP